ncbi:uncharacterized protein G2W53_023504 [Senna tora]|uniref:Uncharacterized protein n=1 Tax=Senna tora TaxID=362788 RepID=A0A834TAH4_9FABA|nr:uncharacterized protein G2W53_023504 [Senna tora]
MGGTQLYKKWKTDQEARNNRRPSKGKANRFSGK